jgi:hypothetical protein
MVGGVRPLSAALSAAAGGAASNPNSIQFNSSSASNSRRQTQRNEPNNLVFVSFSRVFVFFCALCFVFFNFLLLFL